MGEGRDPGQGWTAGRLGEIQQKQVLESGLYTALGQGWRKQVCKAPVRDSIQQMCKCRWVFFQEHSAQLEERVAGPSP